MLRLQGKQRRSTSHATQAIIRLLRYTLAQQVLAFISCSGALELPRWAQEVSQPQHLRQSVAGCPAATRRMGHKADILSVGPPARLTCMLLSHMRCALTRSRLSSLPGSGFRRAQ